MFVKNTVLIICCLLSWIATMAQEETRLLGTFSFDKGTCETTYVYIGKGDPGQERYKRNFWKGADWKLTKEEYHGVQPVTLTFTAKADGAVIFRVKGKNPKKLIAYTTHLESTTYTDQFPVLSTKLFSKNNNKANRAKYNQIDAALMSLNVFCKYYTEGSNSKVESLNVSEKSFDWIAISKGQTITLVVTPLMVGGNGKENGDSGTYIRRWECPQQSGEIYYEVKYLNQPSQENDTSIKTQTHKALTSSTEKGPSKKAGSHLDIVELPPSWEQKEKETMVKQKSSTATKYRNDGIALYRSGSYQDAASLLRKAIENDPNDDLARDYLELAEQKTKTPSTKTEKVSSGNNPQKELSLAPIAIHREGSGKLDVQFDPKPMEIITGLGARANLGKITTLLVKTQRMGIDGNLTQEKRTYRKGKKEHDSPEALVQLPENMVAIGVGIAISKDDVICVHLYARKLEKGRLTGKTMIYRAGQLPEHSADKSYHHKDSVLTGIGIKGGLTNVNLLQLNLAKIE